MPGAGERRGQGLAQQHARCRYTCQPVYAVIKTGGKQERVEEGQRLAVERLGATDGDEVSFAPVLLVDGETVLATPAQLSGAKVTGASGRRGEGAEGTRLRLQIQNSPAPLMGSSPGLRRHRGDRDHQGGLRGVQDKGRR